VTTTRIAVIAGRLKPLLRLASDYAIAQAVIRLFAAVSSLLLVRLLPVSEYGYYTLLLAAFTFISTFSDMGVTESLSFFRLRARRKNRPWLHYFHAVLRFRRTVFLAGFAASSVYVLYVGSRFDKDMFTTAAAIALMGCSAFAAIHAGTTAYALRLELRFRAAYLVELGNEAAKLLVIGVLWTLSLTTAIAGMASVAMGVFTAATLATMFLGRVARPMAASHRHINRSNRMLLGQIAPVIPGTIHFALQGPLVAWLATHYGSVSTLAEIGALGRLAVIIGFFAGFSSTVFVPRLVSMTDEARFTKQYLRWWAVLLAYGGLMLAAIAAFPDALLWLLGSGYKGLHDELLVACSTAIVATWGAYSWQINRARGWVKYQLYRVPVMVLIQVALVLALDLSNARSILLFVFLSTAFDTLFQTLISVAGFWARRPAPNPA
jgi:O-antigen/teichoic acid export membrane protein